MPGMVRWIMRIIMAGASGLIGSDLSARLRSGGHEVIRLVRRAPATAGRIPMGSCGRAA